MTISVANVNANTDTFGSWITKVNQLADAVSTKVVTAESNTTTGNVSVNGVITSTTLYVNAIAGYDRGTSSLSNLVISTNTFISGANISFNADVLNLGPAVNVSIIGANATHRVMTANSLGRINITQITTSDISSFNINSPSDNQLLVYNNASAKWVNSSNIVLSISNTANLVVTTSANLAGATVANTSGIISTANITGAVVSSGGATSNSTGTYPVSNTSGSALGSATKRWGLTAGNIAFSGTMTGGLIASMTSVNSAIYTIGTTFTANGSGIYHNGILQGTSHTSGTYGGGGGGFIANSTVVATGNSTANAFISPESVSISNANTQLRAMFVGSGTAAFGANGEIRAINNITAYYTSDERLKENIAPIEHALDKLTAITGVEFDWTDSYIDEHGGEDGYFVRKHDVGVIAQEIEEVLPEVVATREDGYKAVKYDRIVALLIEAVKELKAEVDALKKG
jgi:hypothetical protein